MKLLPTAAAGALLAAAVALGAPRVEAQAAKTPDPTAILAQAREALGGEKKVAALASFTAEGRTRRNQGNTQVSLDFQIGVQFPDKYYKSDLTPATGSTSFTGFNADTLLTDTPMPAPPAGAAAQMQAAMKARITGLKQDVARLTLGMIAGSLPSYPLTFTYVGEAEAPQGRAEVIDVKGDGNFAVRLFINEQTHLPIMLSWPVAAPVWIKTADQPQPPGAIVIEPKVLPPTATVEEKAAAAKDAQDRQKAARDKKPMTESRVYYSDYRDVDGLKFPFLIRRATGSETTEETTFDKFKVNPKIDPKKFEVPK